MQVSSLLHAMLALLPGKEPTVSTEYMGAKAALGSLNNRKIFCTCQE